MEKIMTKWKRVNNYYSYVNCARPSNLREARALMEMGFCVEDLTEEIMKNYLDIEEYNLKEFHENYSWKDLKYMGDDLDFFDIFHNETQIWVSNREGEDEWIVPNTEDLSYFFEMYLDEVNHSILQDALQRYEERRRQLYNY